MISRNQYYRQGWVCPTCNNGDDHLNAVQECTTLHRQITSVTDALDNGAVWCVVKVCSKCTKRWVFKTNNSYTVEELTKP